MAHLWKSFDNTCCEAICIIQSYLYATLFAKTLKGKRYELWEPDMRLSEKKIPFICCQEYTIFKHALFIISILVYGLGDKVNAGITLKFLFYK